MALRTRRTVLQAAAAFCAAVALSPGAAAAQAAAPRVDVVKIMSFSCPVCRSAEAQDKPIAQTVSSYGGKFIWAPLPTGESLSGAKETVYYASREIPGAMSEAVKQSLYKGVQDMAVPLDDLLQVYVWFQQDMPDGEAKFKPVFDIAQKASARQALGRAAKLATEAGVQSLPAYILLVDNQVAGVLDPTNVSGGSLTALREAVIARIHKLSKR
jgi:hypothetical protein